MRLFGGSGCEARLAGEPLPPLNEGELLAPRLLLLSPLLILLLPGPPAEVRMWDLRVPNRPAVVALWGGSDSVASLTALGSAFLLLSDGPCEGGTPTLRGAYVTSRGGALEPRDWSFSIPELSASFVAVRPQPGAPDGGRLLLVSSRGSLLLLDTATKIVVARGNAPEWEEGDDAADAREALEGVRPPCRQPGMCLRQTDPRRARCSSASGLHCSHLGE